MRVLLPLFVVVGSIEETKHILLQIVSTVFGSDRGPMTSFNVDLQFTCKYNETFELFTLGIFDVSYPNQSIYFLFQRETSGPHDRLMATTWDTPIIIQKEVSYMFNVRGRDAGNHIELFFTINSTCVRI